MKNYIASLTTKGVELKLGEDVLRQTSAQEEEIIKKEMLPVVTEEIETTIR